MVSKIFELLSSESYFLIFVQWLDLVTYHFSPHHKFIHQILTSYLSQADVSRLMNDKKPNRTVNLAPNGCHRLLFFQIFHFRQHLCGVFPLSIALTDYLCTASWSGSPSEPSSSTGATAGIGCWGRRRVSVNTSWVIMRTQVVIYAGRNPHPHRAGNKWWWSPWPLK